MEEEKKIMIVCGLKFELFNKKFWWHPSYSEEKEENGISLGKDYDGWTIIGWGFGICSYDLKDIIGSHETAEKAVEKFIETLKILNKQTKDELRRQQEILDCFIKEKEKENE